MLATPPAPHTVTLPVSGSPARFPVNRVLCLGRNYHWGAPSEPQGEAPPPLYFMKPASAVIDASGQIPFPPATAEFCHEIELVVAIAEGGFRIPASQALAHVWGYAAGLDMTRRDLQTRAKAEGQSWEAAKAFDGAAPIAPLVPVAECGHPAQGAIWLRVNGEERQRGDLAQLITPVAEAIALLSQYLRLQPGDLIMTGTPPGVAPLQPGDLIEAGIDGVGALEVRVGPRP
ncbi:fumarylacetoacetate hydrolase family protein [Pseudomonas typographi]|uniref:Fumarylacetoacetate hydrolase family protein n=2 Tax=Pseudomonas typographi TaxID=2715964 RepID=A0ABR7Z243_9PSED|nr:fumarylacetoacetate hydrolase family protein [Pseudomonas typographi]MBD1587239.1 fumarylacetoacetate hydrolase family protein [Pseudomonas typographi]MBD1599554.1 fumarylacetoacetate hydrolase family protein [Pseudomonas typographi]